MLFAQALGEYGALTAVTSTVSRAWTTAEYFVSDLEPSTWAIVAVAVVLFLVLRRR